MEDLALIEKYCVQLYESTDAEDRAKAERLLSGFFADPSSVASHSDNLAKCQFILERSELPYAQVLAVNAISKILCKAPASLTMEQRLSIRNFALNILYNRGSKLASYVVQAYLQLFGKITKFGWFDVEDNDFVFRGVILDVGNFLQGNLDQCALGIQLLSSLVQEMNQCKQGRRMNEHRKIMGSFRDNTLLEILKLTCNLLQEGAEKRFDSDGQLTLLSHLVKLALNCLSFDFIGVSQDESTDEMGTVQIPAGWRPFFVDPKTLPLFFDMYHLLPASHCANVVACIGQMASVRRSLLTTNERVEYFENIVQGVKSILASPSHLSDSAAYHEFCRLMARLKSNYQLSEFVKVPCYDEFISLFANFTRDSLQMVDCPSNSLHYLLSLWHRLVASVPYIRVPEQHFLDKYAPEVCKVYMSSRLNHVIPIIEEDRDDPLDDQVQLQQQLEQISVIGRCEYDKVATVLMQMFDTTIVQYQLALQNASARDCRIKEAQLTWLVYITSALLGGRISFNVSEHHDQLDGELICRVLRLMDGVNSRLPQQALTNLEVSILTFFDQFRKIYIGEQVQKTAPVYQKLSQMLGLKDEMMVLSVIVNKVMSNLEHFSQQPLVLQQTLQLFNDLSVSYSGLRKLIKLDAIQYLLTHHTQDHLPFLRITASSSSGDTQTSHPLLSIKEMRHRTTFYTSLTRLLLVDLNEEDDRFDDFLAPLTITLDSLCQQLTNGTFFNGSEIAKRAFVGICRDLRGITFALNSRAYLILFFDWLYPKYTPLFQRAIEMWHSEPDVTTPALKFVSELVQNRYQRLSFDNSPVGFVIFRECSAILCTYASRILSSSNIPKDKEYQLRLKGISICFFALKSTFSGNFVNFAVFRFYNDKALDNVLDAFVKMLYSVSREDLLHYPKLSGNYYALLECLSAEHMHFLANLDSQVFLYILATIAEGLVSLDSAICTSCCTTLDNILAFLYKQVARFSKPLSKRRPPSALEPQINPAFIQVLDLTPDLLSQMLSSVMNTIMYDECKNQWSLSRPLLTLILLREQQFADFRKAAIASLPLEKQAEMTRIFDALMEDITPCLTQKNKDKFTQNIAVFRRDIGELLHKTTDCSFYRNVSGADDAMS